MLKTERTQQYIFFKGPILPPQIPLKISKSHVKEKLQQVSWLTRHHSGLKVSNVLILPTVQRPVGKSESGLHSLEWKFLGSEGG